MLVDCITPGDAWCPRSMLAPGALRLGLCFWLSLNGLRTLLLDATTPRLQASRRLRALNQRQSEANATERLMPTLGINNNVLDPRVANPVRRTQGVEATRTRRFARKIQAFDPVTALVQPDLIR